MTSIKCTLVLSNNFKKQYKKAAKQGKNLDKIDKLMYYENNKLNLLLIVTGSHSELFK